MVVEENDNQINTREGKTLENGNKRDINCKRNG